MSPFLPETDWLRAQVDRQTVRAEQAEVERDNYCEALGEIETVLEEGSLTPLPRLRAWNLARQVLNGEADKHRSSSTHGTSTDLHDH